MPMSVDSATTAINDSVLGSATTNKLNNQTVSVINATGTAITRPANTTAYASGDLVAGADQSVTGTTAASKTITAISDVNIAKLKVGMYITDGGTKIPADSYITSVTASGSDNNSITFNNAAGTNATAGTGVSITARQVVLVFDLSTNNSDFPNGGKFQLNEVEISDSSTGCGTAGTQLNLILFNSMPYPTTPTDNGALSLSTTELAKRTTGAGKILDTNLYGATSLVKQTDICRFGSAEASTKLIYGILQAITFTSGANSNVLTPTIKGVRLS